MATETVTHHLPDSVYQTARQVAEATRLPLDAVLAASIAHALPPLDDVPDEQAADLAALAFLDDGALWRAARATLSAEIQTELSELLNRQSEGALTETEPARLELLLALYGRQAVRTAHAYLLLARRGYRVPMQDDTG